MTISGVLILLWFVFIIITSAFGLRYYGGDSIEVMLFVLFMALIVIGMAFVINISLSIDLIAESKIKELKFTDNKVDYGKLLLKWGLGVVGMLVVLISIGGFFIKWRKLNQAETITTEVVESHQENLEQIFGYIQDSSKILKVKDVISTVNRSSDEIRWAEVILIEEVLGKASLLAFSAGTDSAQLIDRTFENLIIVPSEEEKELIRSLLTGEKVGAQSLEVQKDEIRGYYPISKNGKTMVIRIEPMVTYRSIRR